MKPISTYTEEKPKAWSAALDALLIPLFVYAAYDAWTSPKFNFTFLFTVLLVFGILEAISRLFRYFYNIEKKVELYIKE